MPFRKILLATSLLASTSWAEVSKEGQFKDLQFYGFSPNQNNSNEEILRAKGLDNIFQGKGFRIGIPLRSLDVVENLKGTKDIFSQVKDRIQGQEHLNPNSDLALFQNYGKLPSPPTRAKIRKDGVELNVPDLMAGQFEYKGSYYRNTNCFMCHSGVAGGIVTAGMPNNHTDQVGYSAELALLLKLRPILQTHINTLALSQNSKLKQEAKELQYYLDDMDGETQSVLSKALVRGDNMGPYVVWKKLSRIIDPATQGFLTYAPKEESPFDHFFDVAELPPVDPNPWWTRKYKSTSYRYGEPAPHIAAHFALNFTKPTPYVNDYHPQHVQDISEILYFAEKSSSPPYPKTLDADKVELGRKLFHGEKAIATGRVLPCAGCHGTYDKKENTGLVGGYAVTYQDTGLIDVGTDPAYNSLLQTYGDLKKHADGFSQFFSDSDLVPAIYLPQTSGYIAPPLVGAWASAPYFHNGSAPTLYHVLNSASRPAVWSRTNSDPFAYNFKETGLDFATIDIKDEEYAQWKAQSIKDPMSSDAREFRSWYNTRLQGRSNAGHRFGDAMNDEERYAVIEFLKSLSGPDMPAANPKSKRYYKFQE